jgi:Tfp pilus assembly protein PilX
MNTPVPLKPLRRQRGLTMLVVLLLMSAMLLGALSLARITEAGTLVTGNVTAKEGSVHAAEVGRNAANAQLLALASKNTNAGSWYFATTQPVNAATGIPSAVDFNAAGTVAGGVGRFDVRYVVERLCTVNDVKNSAVECLVVPNPNVPSNRSFGAPAYMSAGARQYRITVRVTDARGTQTWTQSLVSAP